MEEIGVQIRRLNYKVKVLVHAGKKENKKSRNCEYQKYIWGTKLQISHLESRYLNWQFLSANHYAIFKRLESIHDFLVS